MNNISNIAVEEGREMMPVTGKGYEPVCRTQYHQKKWIERKDWIDKFFQYL